MGEQEEGREWVTGEQGEGSAGQCMFSIHHLLPCWHFLFLVEHSFNILSN
jgi:hypothetical protein